MYLLANIRSFDVNKIRKVLSVVVRDNDATSLWN